MTTALSLLVLSVLLVADVLGILPDRRQAVLKGRAALTEALAISASAFASFDQQGNDALSYALAVIVERNGDILSAGLRKSNGELLTEAGPHSNLWPESNSERSIDTRIQVPIYDGERQASTLEVSFTPIYNDAIPVGSRRLLMILFVTGASAALFYFYLHRVLLYLDPGKSVPDRVRTALDTLTEGVVILDDRDRIVLANRAFAALVGETSDRLLGLPASSLPISFSDGWVDSEAPWVAARRDNDTHRNILTSISVANSTDSTLVLNCAPINGPDQKCRGVLLSLEDVTPLESKKRELAEARAVADIANQAKSDFLAAMSHEIRTPMNAIMGFTDLLRRGHADDAREQQRYLNIVYSNGQHLLELINEILDLSKIEAGQITVDRSRCSPGDIVTEVASIMSLQASEKGIALNFTSQKGVPATVLTDPMRLRQILTNLIGNAVKFTNRGSVEVKIDCQPHDATNQLVIDVIDTGVGIAPNRLDRVFDPFAQADSSITRRFGGTGLGLTICRQFARALGGDVVAKSSMGRGSVFTLTIDAGDLEGIEFVRLGTVSAESGGDSPKTAVQFKRASVLVVEDGVENRELITTILRRSGLDVTAAENGQVAIDRTRERSFDAILMDLQMPLMDGMTAAKKMRDRGIDCPLVAITAHAMAKDRDKCLEIGFTDYLTKPLSIDRLLDTMRRVLGEGSELSAREPPASEQVDEYWASDEDEALVSSLPMNDSEFRKIVHDFRRALRSRIDAMYRALEERDHSSIKRHAHWLKGSGGTVGLDAFTRPAAHLETMADRRHEEAVREAIRSVETLADRIVVPIPETAPTASAIPFAGSVES